MIKKFSEILTEAKKGTGIAEHDEAAKIVKKHSAALEHVEGDHEDEREHIHLGAVHPKKIENLHHALKAAGFKHHGSDAGAHYGAHSGDHDSYHHYTKGKVNVRIATKPNTYGNHPDYDKNTDHHHVEVHTSKDD